MSKGLCFGFMVWIPSPTKRSRTCILTQRGECVGGGTFRGQTETKAQSIKIDHVSILASLLQLLEKGWSLREPRPLTEVSSLGLVSFLWAKKLWGFLGTNTHASHRCEQDGYGLPSKWASASLCPLKPTPPFAFREKNENICPVVKSIPFKTNKGKNK